MVWLIIFIALLMPSILSAKDEAYVFVIDENQLLLSGYKVIDTLQEDIFLGSTKPLKKWITHTKSELFLLKRGFLFKVKEVQIVNKAKGLVLFAIDSSDKRNIFLNLKDVSIEKDTKILIENREWINTRFRKNLSPTIKTEEEPLLLAKHYESIGQIEKASVFYEKALKNNPGYKELIEKLALLNYKIGKFSESKNFIMKLPQNQENLIRLIGILMIEKNFSEALTFLNNSTYKDLPYFHYLRGIIYSLIGEKDEAYKEVIKLSKKDSALAQSLRDFLR
jgi:tetratricopeptide (TPR) repeat protein